MNRVAAVLRRPTAERTVKMEALLEWKWGFFSPTHIATIILAIVFPIVLYFILKHKSERVQKIVLFLFSLLGPITMINEIVCYAPMQSILVYLPIHLCSINAILTPILVCTKNEFIGNLTPLFSIGSGLAVIFNTIQAEYSILSVVFILYYSSHAMGCAIPFLMAKLGLIRIRPKYILPSLATLFGLYTVVHFINVWINTACAAGNIVDGFGDLIQVNYMFSISTQGNPALEFFWSLIPYEYFYMLAVFPIIAVYYLLLNIKDVIAFFKNKFGKEPSEETLESESQEASDNTVTEDATDNTAPEAEAVAEERQ